MHGRPPAFGGPDGGAYSAAATVDDAPAADGRYGAFLLFIRWDLGGPSSKPGGHLETPYLSFGATADEALAPLHALPLEAVKAHLDACVAKTETHA